MQGIVLPRRNLAMLPSGPGWYPWWNVLGEHAVITPADVIVQNQRRVMKWCMVFYWEGRGCVYFCVHVLNEEQGGTICLTAATKDDEIVSERKSTCVCPACPFAPPFSIHTHVLRNTHSHTGSSLSPFSSLIGRGRYTEGSTQESHLSWVDCVTLLLVLFLFVRQLLPADDKGVWGGQGVREREPWQAAWSRVWP